MNYKEYLLYNLAKRWPSPIKLLQDELGGDPASEEYQMNYAYKQFDGKVCNGIGFPVRNKKIVEIGCGHGGISIFLALNGAIEVIGIDLNTQDLSIARKIKSRFETELLNKDLPVTFLEMNAYEMTLPESHFDFVIADNVFEHFMEPKMVLEQSFKILKPGGKLIVPRFSSIWSKYGLHLKNGLKMPWANLFFSEKKICKVMIRIIEENPHLKEIYAGYINKPTKVRDLRRYSDLNTITYSCFKKMAIDVGFEVEQFQVFGSPRIISGLIRKLPIVKNSILGDVFSVAASSVLIKR
jgi:ubiquinone/menaquinone biosynthesis C-methylase UbiE